MKAYPPNPFVDPHVGWQGLQQAFPKLVIFLPPFTLYYA